ncbi:Uncharacterized protein FWK35_00029287 [Aphis craccivora]|uniref:Uncharacterized protein n=1 Tax=Aphis craccivora TaxID=307492 RepID=A0A6G0VQ17_APHCR|nr:Uncharacterized protein FWK35_00029287 [Aphis craccivora]
MNPYIGPLSTELNNYLNHQYKILIFHDTEIRIHHEADNYVLMTDGNIVKVVNIVRQISNNGFILGYCFETKEPWSVDNIKCKCRILKTVAFPLLHTYISIYNSFITKSII